MRLSQLFTKTSKNHPADETAKNAQLLIQAGYIHKEMAGVYTYLPLGKRVLDNITQVIREEMNAVGGNEISMSALQPKDVWEASGRWSDDVVDVWFKTKLAGGGEVGLAPTHEEPLTNLMKNFITSYKDLPVYPYQFQIKFRNELRAKSGLMRGREFWMKDLYSFSRDQSEHDVFYDKMRDAYIKVYVHEGKKLAINKEVYNDEVLADLGIDKYELVEKPAVEVGNIFSLGTKFSDALNLTFTAEDGSIKPVIMGSYGIGPSRLMGLIAEHFADDKGLVWPKNIAPFQVYLARLGTEKAVLEAADKLYQYLTDNQVTVLYDDRDVRPGEKFADADLIGLPYRVVVSDKTVAGNAFEVKNRTATNSEMVDNTSILERLMA
jgi:prolyl-tRNA synthetase